MTPAFDPDPDHNPDGQPEPVASPPTPKEPAPGLSMRAARPRAILLRKSVVQAFVIGGAVLVSGSLAWAFVVQPELRNSARARAADARQDEARGVVRPAEGITDQPASYDRLPAPRGKAEEPPDEVGEAPVRSEPLDRAPPAYRPAPAAPGGPGPREQAIQSGLFFADAGGGRPPAAAPAVPATGQAQAGGRGGQGDYGGTYNGHALSAPLSPYELKAGAIIPAALLTAVDTSRSGPVIATVTQNIFDSISGRHLLIPQGARLIGRHEGESSYGDRRAFLTWDRIILPNGMSMVLTGEPGVDPQGAVGVRGEVDRRLFPLVVGTLFAGAITTLGQIARDDRSSGASGLLGDAGDAAAIEGSQVGGRLVDRELQVRPSIRLRAGSPVRVMITRDLILEPYRP